MTNTMKRLAVLLIGTLFVLCVAIVLAVSLPVSTAFAAEGEPEATVHDHTDGTWTAVSGNLNYSPFSGGGKYYLSGNTTITVNSATFELSKGEVELCLNGYSLSFVPASTVEVFSVAINAALTICSCRESAENGYGRFSTTEAQAIEIYSKQTLTLSEATLEAKIIMSHNQSADGTRLVVESGRICAGSESQTSLGSLHEIVVSGGELNAVIEHVDFFNMTGGTISNNGTAQYGVSLEDGEKFTMSGGKIDTSGYLWSSLQISGGTFEMTGGEIRGTNATSSGGVTISSGTFNMSGGKICGNNAALGGGVYVTGGTFNMSGGEICENTASEGGGVYVYNGSFTMNGGTISGNTSGDSGGGVYVYNGSFTMNGGTISHNTVPSSGGGVYTTGEFTMTGGTITDNTATSNGGNVYVSGGAFTMNGGYFGGNRGGIYSYNGTISVSGGYFAEEPDEAYLAGNHGAYDISAFGTTLDVNYNENFPFAVYTNGTQITATVTKVLYDGEPVEEDDFKLTGAGDITFNYMYKQADGAYTKGLPAEIGTYTIFAYALDSAEKIYYNTEFSFKIFKYCASVTFDGQTKDYENIVEAFQTVSDLETTAENRALIKLTDSQKIASTAIFNTGFATLDLNGYMLKLTGTGPVINNMRADLILTDSNGADAKHLYYVAEGGLWVFYEGTLPANAPENAEQGTVKGGVITGGNESKGVGVYVDGGTFTMNGGTIAGNASKYAGGGIYVNYGSFTMNGGTISGNTSGDSGGGIYVNYGSFTMNGGTISHNTVPSSGGGVYVHGNSTFTMKSGTITDNTARYGGGVAIGGGTFTMGSGTISGNTAVYNNGGGNGGGVYLYTNTKFTMKNGTISGNAATSNGGGVASETSAITIENSTITNNTATHGGGMNVSGTFSMESSTIAGNTAYSNGGGVYVHGNSTFTMKSGTISDNTAAAGGGVYTYGSFTMENGTISHNTTSHGGGVYTYGSFTMENGTISHNTANQYGGGVYVRGTFTMKNGTISDNTTTYDGSVYVSTNCSFRMEGGTISGNTVQNGGGVCAYNGTFTMTGGTITNNTATKTGSGVCVMSTNANLYGAVTISGGTIADNTAAENGSGVYVDYDSLFTINGGYLGGEIKNDGTVSIFGGYFSEEPDAAYLGEGLGAYDISDFGTALDENYREGFAFAVYKNDTAQITASANNNIVYDGSPVAAGTDFTVTGADGLVLAYAYKTDGNYVSGLPASAGTYIVKVAALGEDGTYNEAEFSLTIAKAAPAYTAPTDLTVVVEGTLADVTLPEGWSWKDGSVQLTETGEYKAVAIYTPADTANYNPVEVELTVTVYEETAAPETPEGLSGGAVAGIVIGCVVGALIIAYGVCALLYRKKLISGAFFAKIYPFVK